MIELIKCTLWKTKNAYGCSKIILVFCFFVLSSCVKQGVFPVREIPDVERLNGKVEWKIERVISPKMLYPKAALENEQAGWVLIRSDISAQGFAENLKAVDYSPNKKFIDTALKYIKGSKFKPYFLNGEISTLRGYYFLVKFKIGPSYLTNSS